MIDTNTIFNRIHEWGEPDHHITTRIFLTRITSLACGVIEALISANTILHAAANAFDAASIFTLNNIRAIFPKLHLTANAIKLSSSVDKLKTKLWQICYLIRGLASTIVFGFVLSPEINFRIHLSLGLVVDNLTVKKQKELKAKLEAEVKAAEISRERTQRFAQFQAQRQAAKDAEAEENAIDAHLAELLVPSVKSTEVQVA